MDMEFHDRLTCNPPEGMDAASSNNGNGFSGENNGRQNTFATDPTADPLQDMVEFQEAIDRLRLRRLSSTSNQGVQGQEGGGGNSSRSSRKSSIVKDQFAHSQQNQRPSNAYSPTCTSPLSSKGAPFT